ncbi:uncharacterized protein LOC132397783 [Hypanus sabinus]|uniref:uncharacterized protein LOC132397783 n=1 Tax=Hypanus sabinus TaxID=79690 RepID=UPI0028C4FE4B|nr:uncharacterized protein LOC132397783 [Hypanus sabinus]
MRTALDEKGALALKKSAGLADEVVSAHGVEFTPEGSCPESNWENQRNLEFGPGTGIESLEEASVPFECVQAGDTHGTEPGNAAQKKSEVFDSVVGDGRPRKLDGPGSGKRGLTLVIVGSVSSPLVVLEGVVRVDGKFTNGEMTVVVEGNGKSVVPKSNEENLKFRLVSEEATRLQNRWLGNTVPAHRLQVDLERKGAPHAVVIQESAVKKPNFKCGLRERFELKPIRLPGLDKRGNVGGVTERDCIIPTWLTFETP